MAWSLKHICLLIMLLAYSASAHAVVDAEESSFELLSDEANHAEMRLGASLFDFPPEAAPEGDSQPSDAQQTSSQDPAQSDPAQPDPAQSDPAQSDPAQSDPAQSDPAQSGPAGPAGPAESAQPAGQVGPAGPPSGPEPPVEHDPCALPFAATPSDAPVFTNGHIGDGASPELQQRQQDVQQALANLRQSAVDACHAWKQRQEDVASAVAAASVATHEKLEQQLHDNEHAEQHSIDELHTVQDEVAVQEAKLAAATKHLEDVKMRYAAAKAIHEASDHGKLRQYGMFDSYSGQYKSVHGGFNTVERTQLRHRL